MGDQGQWQVAGNAAETYERALVPAVFAPWASLVVALADPRPGERVRCSARNRRRCDLKERRTVIPGAGRKSVDEPAAQRAH